MGKLLDLAKTIQRTLHDPLGKWIQAVSVALDSLAPRMTWVEMESDQVVANLATETPIVFDTLVQIWGDGIPYNQATGYFFLAPWGNYELEAYVEWSGFNTQATDRAALAWIDSNGDIIGGDILSTTYPQASTENAASQPIAKAYKQTGSTGVSVRLVSVSGQGAASVTGAGGSHAIVRKIG